MRTEISVINAQIGDVVRDMVSMVGHEGRVCGVDSVGPAVLVRWGGDGGPMDVYSVDSPVWNAWALYRDDDAQAVMPLEDTDTVHAGALHYAPSAKPQPSCGHVLMADESGCPTCTMTQKHAVAEPFGPDGDMERSTDTVNEAAVAKLPWDV